MNIGIDLDDTLANTYELFISTAQFYCHNKLKRSCLKNPYKLSFNEAFDVSKNETDDFYDIYLNQLRESYSIKPYAKYIIKKLKEEENKIYIITARGIRDAYNVSKKWLDNNQILYDELIIDAKDKIDVCKEKNINLMIDDSIKVCNDLADNGISVIIYDSIVNKEFSDNRIPRAYSWIGVYEYIENLKRK